MDNKFAEVLRTAEIVDLTLTLDERLPTAGDWLPPFRHVVYNWYEPLPDAPQPLLSRSFKSTYYSCWITIFEHCGTHFDAPTHACPPAGSGLPGAHDKSIFGDKVLLNRLQGPAAVVDLRPFRAGPQENGKSPIVYPDYLCEWEKVHGEFQPGDIVTFVTGWDEYFVPLPEGANYLMNPLRYKTTPGWPSPARESIIYLANKGVDCCTIDTPSMGAAQDVASVHYELLGRGMVMVENLANLDRLPPRGSYFVFLPLKVARSSGCPGRAFAYVPRVAA